MVDFKRIGERLMLARWRRNLTQEQLSKISGVTQRVISEVERGKREGVAFATIIRLAEVLEVSLDDLITELQPAALDPVGA
jgi:transcriptional regulator with XRE-family HTH domain